MKKSISDYRKIIAALGESLEPLSVSELNDKLPEMSRRTLQRRLNQLVVDEKIAPIGKSNTRKYQPIRTPLEVTKPDEGESVLAIPLTIESKEAIKHVSSPLQQRTPVSYKKEFLLSYTPNKSYYLSESLRADLRAAGAKIDPSNKAGTYVKKIFQRLLIDLSWNSSRLEGNTYSLLETKKLLDFGILAEGKDRSEAQMILNHKSAIEMLVYNNDKKIELTSHTVRNIHAVLSDNLLANKAASGRLRQIAVGIGKSVYHPLEVPQHILPALENSLLKCLRGLGAPPGAAVLKVKN